MSENYNDDIVTIIDEDGQESNLELVETMDYKGQSYAAFLPADLDENDPDYGWIILRIVVEDNEEVFESIDDDAELNEVFEKFMILLDMDSEE